MNFLTRCCLLRFKKAELILRSSLSAVGGRVKSAKKGRPRYDVAISSLAVVATCVLQLLQLDSNCNFVFAFGH